MTSKSSPLIFERSREGRYAYSLPISDIKTNSVESLLDDKFIRKNKAEFPEVAELDLVRHYTELSNKNFGVDNGFYPLGSCTMKYNPKINEKVARIPGFS
ncbi:TPA: aminomethyl-transferring glycine dehydrogenase subunit GcvPB, partial [Staphylococcus aureus]|nr:aminomethyl-transferring glycine dehydrogenase subunit GcvPB [Staphylococcus aureus]